MENEYESRGNNLTRELELHKTLTGLDLNGFERSRFSVSTSLVRLELHKTYRIYIKPS